MEKDYCKPKELPDSSKRKVAIASIMAGLEMLLEERFEKMEQRIFDRILKELNK